MILLYRASFYVLFVTFYFLQFILFAISLNFARCAMQKAFPERNVQIINYARVRVSRYNYIIYKVTCQVTTTKVHVDSLC